MGCYDHLSGQELNDGAGMTVAPDWQPITATDPPQGSIVVTKIDGYGGGERNVQSLKRGPGKLWFFPDGSMYVYYTPTHYVRQRN